MSLLRTIIRTLGGILGKKKPDSTKPAQTISTDKIAGQKEQSPTAKEPEKGKEQQIVVAKIEQIRNPKKHHKRAKKEGGRDIKKLKTTLHRLEREVLTLRKKVKERQMNPKKALTNVKNIYNRIITQDSDIEEQISGTKSLMKGLQKNLAQKKINEREFKARMQQHRENLSLLNIHKKGLLSQKSELKSATLQLPLKSPINLEKLSREKNLRSLLAREPGTLEKIAIAQRSTPRRAIALSSIAKKIPRTSKYLQEIQEQRTKRSQPRPVEIYEVPQQQVKYSQTKTTENVFEEVPQKISYAKNTKKSVQKEVKEVYEKPQIPVPSDQMAPDRQVSSAMPQKKVEQQRVEEHKEEAEKIEKSFPQISDSKKINAFLEQKAAGKINEGKLVELEAKVDLLMEKYKIPEKELEEKFGKVNTSNVLESIGRLINLIELERDANAKIKPEKIQTALPVTENAKQVEEVVGIATEIKKHRIVTDFDKLITLLVQKGRMKFTDIAKELSISMDKVEECCRILQQEKLIEVVYPPFGDALAQTLEYRQKMELEKIKKKMQGGKGG
ncbi:MAG TPA: hypothetical protein VJG83_03390 [archaeon]|nr:hypothetical protein [archaeon]